MSAVARTRWAERRTSAKDGPTLPPYHGRMGKAAAGVPRAHCAYRRTRGV